MWREHVGLSVTDGSQKQAMMESICSAFVFGARPNGTLGHFMMPRYEDGSKRSNVCYWQILLQKSFGATNENFPGAHRVLHMAT
jgi:hypothetical protein